MDAGWELCPCCVAVLQWIVPGVRGRVSVTWGWGLQLGTAVAFSAVAAVSLGSTEVKDTPGSCCSGVGTVQPNRYLTDDMVRKPFLTAPNS